MVFFPKHLGFHSLGILLSICTQNWGGKISCGQTTAIAFDTAVPHYWPLLILWAAHEGYFHKNCCCWIRVLLCFCVMKLLIPSKPCLSMVNRKWGGGFLSTFHLCGFVPSCARMPRGNSLKISPGCIPAKCTNLRSSIPGYFKDIFLYRKYRKSLGSGTLHVKKKKPHNFTSVLQQFRSTVNCFSYLF